MFTERLDRTRPPPGFDLRRLDKALQMTVAAAGVWGPQALAAAWTVYQAEHDPPGMRIDALSARGRTAMWNWYWKAVERSKCRRCNGRGREYDSDLDIEPGPCLVCDGKGLLV